MNVFNITILRIIFQGFVISDWEGIDKITSPPHSNYSYSVQAGVQAGIDMVSLALSLRVFLFLDYAVDRFCR